MVSGNEKPDTNRFQTAKIYNNRKTRNTLYTVQLSLYLLSCAEYCASSHFRCVQLTETRMLNHNSNNNNNYHNMQLHNMQMNDLLL